LHLARQTIARRNNYANLRMTLTISTILNMPTMLTAIFLEKTGFVGNCTSLFLPRDAMHARYYRHGPVSVCLSVCLCLSVTSRCSTKTAKRSITKTTPHDSPGSLVFDVKDLREIRPGSPPTGAANAGGVGQNRRLSTNNCYISKTVKDRPIFSI